MTISNAYDAYWKLDDYEQISKSALNKSLHAAGYKDLQSHWPKYRLLPKQHRIDRGLIVYDRCTDEELEKFARDRGVSKPLLSKASLADALANIKTLCLDNCNEPDLRKLVRKGLFVIPQDKRIDVITDLEAADQDQVFGRFTDLPPELRGRVYDFYLAGFGRRLMQPTTPPLARINKLLRTEVLQKFYRWHTFELVFKRRENTKARFRADEATQFWLFNLREECAQDINRVGVVVKGTSKYGNGWQDDRVLCTYEVKLTKTGTGVEIWPAWDIPDSQASTQFYKHLRDTRTELQDLLRNLAEVEGVKRFMKNDFYAMRNGLEKAAEDGPYVIN